MKAVKRLAIAVGLLVASFVAFALMSGSILVAPHPQAVHLPADLAAAESVVFPSQSGSQIHASFLAGTPGRGAILILHGLQTSRTAMAGRARMLAHEGYSVLFIDFQAHGESPGEHVTFGYLESRDAAAAVAYLKSREPKEKIGLIGVSMGGAAATLASPPLPVDAMVLEEVYPTLVEAVDSRLTVQLGVVGPLFAPALTLQLRPRLGISTAALRPIAEVPGLRMPKLFIVGADDRHTTLAQSQALFAAAAEPKELWVVKGAQHVDMLAFAGDEYADRVKLFLAKALR